MPRSCDPPSRATPGFTASWTQAYDDAPRVRFMDMRRLFDGVTDCIYMDAIHYNDAGNAIIAGRMVEDLKAAGVAPPSP